MIITNDGDIKKEETEGYFEVQTVTDFKTIQDWMLYEFNVSLNYFYKMGLGKFKSYSHLDNWERTIATKLVKGLDYVLKSIDDIANGKVPRYNKHNNGENPVDYFINKVSELVIAMIKCIPEKFKDEPVMINIHSTLLKVRNYMVANLPT